MSERGKGRNVRTTRGSVSVDVRSTPGSVQKRDSSTGSESARPPPNQSAEIHNCGMCGHKVGNDAIGCDRCSNWVHPTEMCSGLPEESIKTIASLSGDAVLFVCTNCRVKQPGTSTKQKNSAGGCSDPLLQQLFLSVKGICSAVMELTARMDQAFSLISSSSRPPTPAQHPPQPVMTEHSTHRLPAPSDEEYRSVIRQEMLEMQERAKRKQSVIVRGMKAQFCRELVIKFGDLSQDVMGTRVELSDVVRIPGHSDLFRAKILDDVHRKLVLDKAKTLKDSAYSSVFIRRDLTFAQRKDLRERRAQWTANRDPPRPHAPEPARAQGAENARAQGAERARAQGAETQGAGDGESDGASAQGAGGGESEGARAQGAEGDEPSPATSDSSN